MEADDLQDWRAPDLGTMAAKMGIDPAVLQLETEHIGRSPDFPYLGFVSGKAPKTIYLDTLHWVALAKARLGRPAQQEDADAYEFLRQAATSGDIVVPICATSFMEISRITSLRQRSDLSDVIGEISGFVTLVDATIAKDHQIELALAERLDGERPPALRTLGIGVGFAFGKRGGIL
ncbi:hypothetical protein ABZ783_35975 [Micromonospora sp. NPDC047738]|uniref:hypothetical protein n=1 Tax=Micromonospora sp. NPDC047738 TaxID=3155741 RepID=UPI0033CAED60